MLQDNEVTILDHTKSVCPVCLKAIDAQVVVRDNIVYLDKVCPDHGSESIYYWPDADHYRWMNDFRLPYKTPKTQTTPMKDCPSDCGLCSSHLRRPTLVEIEVTQHCNLRCPVCFASADTVVTCTTPPDPSIDIIEEMYKKILKENGPQTSIQLTGGEPTIRHNLPEIVELGKKNGFSAIEINTNGVVIGKDPMYIQRLAEAGISGIYLQFDGLTPMVYQKIRGADLLDLKLKAIENCREAGVQVALSMTVIAGINDDQIGAVLGFALKNRDVVAGIAYQPAFGSGRFEVSTERSLNMGDVIFMLSQQSNGIIEPYDLWPLGCSHPLCSSSTYIIERNGKFEPLNRRFTPQEYSNSFDNDSPQGSVFADIAANKYPEYDPGVSIVIENYLDAMTMDLKRLKECSMIVMSADQKFVPFCSHKLTKMIKQGDTV